jgi:phosphate transport system permease protein
MLALGATRWEAIRHAVLPYARGGIIGAAMLGFARAVGETMAVTMLIGNVTGQITPSLFAAGGTLASAIANQYGDTTSDLHFAAIIELGLVLMLLASLFNILARLLVRQITQLPVAK